MPSSTSHAHIPQNEAGAAGAPNPIAETIGFRARIGPDPHLIKRPGAAAA
jgi:hypothetical protein